jgi:hypothetical protein
MNLDYCSELLSADLKHYLAEDLTGHGHTTRVVGQVPRVTATIHVEG